ncbi:MAG TPA: hypothetical protein VJ829_07040 [Candidatus Binatia bacterium]|nr:hypothetical protein [Candidatus Binatia bacterium]
MAYYAEKDFFADDKLIELVTGILNGNLTLEWFDVETARLQAKPADPARGLTYQDCNLGPYGYDAIPELVRNRNSMASRGSVLVPNLPDLGYTINRKSDVWSDDVCTLYEEAKSRRWAPAVDVPWPELRAIPDPLREAAVAQLCTLLEEVALVAAEAPARWVFVINQEFLELKSFLCVQMFDEARHVEACRKRALASGHGLGHASVSAEQALKELLSAETYPEASLATNVLLGSFVLAMYRAFAALARTRTDRVLATLSMQDVARSVAYGVGHMRYHVQHQPAKASGLNEYLDRTEHTVVGIAGSTEWLEPLIVLAAGSRERPALARGSAFARRWFSRTVSEYLERCRAAGLGDRSARSRLPALAARLAA